MHNFTDKELRQIYDLGPEATIGLLRQLITTIHQLSEKVELVSELTAEVETLRARVKTLEAQLAKDSHNSSKPPSSDGFKKKTKSLRDPSNRSSGGQKGHRGHTLKRVAIPNHIKIHKAKRCPCCASSLKDVAVSSYESRQVFDIPKVNIEVTEHRAEIKTCPHCQAKAKGVFPGNISQSVQYGSRIKAQAIYLMNYHMLPYGRTCEMLEDFYGHQISEGSLYNFQKSCYQLLENPIERIKQHIIKALVVHCDETGLRIAKKLHWLHAAGTNQYTYFQVHSKRGKDAMDEAGILPFFFGTAVHDFWKPYLKYEKCTHSLCNAHLLRDLIFLIEQKKQKWAVKMKKLLLDIKSEVQRAKTFQKQEIDAATLKQFELKYRDIIAIGFKENPEYPSRRKRKQRTKAQNLLLRLENYRTSVLAFMYNIDVPFDNNQAERDVRMVKVQQKVSGCFRSFDGAVMFCRIKSFMASARKQRINILDAVQNALNGKDLLTIKLPE